MRISVMNGTCYSHLNIISIFWNFFFKNGNYFNENVTAVSIVSQVPTLEFNSKLNHDVPESRSGTKTIRLKKVPQIPL